ncbi:hypothetical protein [Nocardia brasiliensis]|uniref:hypothetical protein n=1 Tax=Nocardia brasiliensis TaxID=37326 RepID=UPI002454AE67|nr:hypothetical protein [Nocardia brasiliensis]
MTQVLKVLSGRTVLGVDDDGTAFELFHVSDPDYYGNAETALDQAMKDHKRGLYRGVRSFIVVEV